MTRDGLALSTGIIRLRASKGPCRPRRGLLNLSSGPIAAGDSGIGAVGASLDDAELSDGIPRAVTLIGSVVEEGLFTVALLAYAST
jgi:hypothetical protein